MDLCLHLVEVWGVRCGLWFASFLQKGFGGLFFHRTSGHTLTGPDNPHRPKGGLG